MSTSNATEEKEANNIESNPIEYFTFLKLRDIQKKLANMEALFGENLNADKQKGKCSEV